MKRNNFGYGDKRYQRNLSLNSQREKQTNTISGMPSRTVSRQKPKLKDINLHLATKPQQTKKFALSFVFQPQKQPKHYVRTRSRHRCLTYIVNYANRFHSKDKCLKAKLKYCQQKFTKYSVYMYLDSVSCLRQVHECFIHDKTNILCCR